MSQLPSPNRNACFPDKMKRFSQGGDSPGPKIKLLADTDSDLSSEESYNYDIPGLSDTTDNFEFGHFPSQGSSQTSSQFSKLAYHFSNISSPAQHISTPILHGLDQDNSSNSDTDSFIKGDYFDDMPSSPDECDERLTLSQPLTTLSPLPELQMQLQRFLKMKRSGMKLLN